MKGRILALDYGRKRIGRALSDPLRVSARPHDVLVRIDPKTDLSAIDALVREESVTMVVLGWPRNADGSEGEMVDEVKAFAAELESVIEVPVRFADETYSSLEADELLRAKHGRDHKKRRSERDAFAAAIILRRWLESYERD